MLRKALYLLRSAPCRAVPGAMLDAASLVGLSYSKLYIWPHMIETVLKHHLFGDIR
jgi:hypothetical protein